MLPQQREEGPRFRHLNAGQRALLQAGQQCRLLGRAAVAERLAGGLPSRPVQRSQAPPIGIDQVVVGAGQRPIQVGDHAYFSGAGPVFARRKQALEDSGGGARFEGVERQ